MSGKKNETTSCCGGDGLLGARMRVEAVISCDERGQMVLPKDVRERSGFAPGEKLAVVTWERDGRVCCLSLIKTEELAGMVKEVLGPLVQEIMK